MSGKKLNLGHLIGVHRGKFVASIVVGTVLALGVRSLFVDAGGERLEAQANSPPAEHHAEPGHDGHAHDAAAPQETDGHDGNGEPPPAAKGDEHAGHDKPVDKKAAAESKKPVGALLDLGNANCPVMGGEVDGKTFTEWNGLRVGHCCPGCSKGLLKDPETLLDEVSPTWRDAAKAAKAIDAADGKEQEKLMAAAAEKWPVVRKPATKAPAGLLIDVGNADCPVMGGEVNGKTFTEWNGLRVGHCCPGCTKRFLKNPEALLDEVSPKWREVAAAVKKFNDAEGKARVEALAAIRKQWSVVREPAPAKSK